MVSFKRFGEISRRSVVRGLALAAAPLAAYSAKSAASFDEVDNSMSTDGLSWQPLKLQAYRYVTTEVIINGHAVRAIVDSGATRSIIAKELVQRLGLSERGTRSTAGLTGDVSGTVYQLDSVKIGEIELRHFDITNYSGFGSNVALSDLTPLLIGQDILSHFAVEIDFPGDRIRFDKPIGRTAPSGFTGVDLLGPRQAVTIVKVNVNNNIPADALIDLGSSVLCSVAESFAKDHLHLDEIKSSTTMTVGLEGSVIGRLFSIPHLSLGGFVLRNVSACAVERWNLPVPINLGWPLFQAFDMILDDEHSKLWLSAKAGDLAMPLPRDRSGIGAARQRDRLLVRHVGLNSPAEIAGLKVGDEIIARDGRQIDDSYPAPGDRHGYRPAGTVLKLRLSTGRELHLELQDYY